MFFPSTHLEAYLVLFHVPRLLLLPGSLGHHGASHSFLFPSCSVHCQGSRCFPKPQALHSFCSPLSGSLAQACLPSTLCLLPC